MNDIWLDKIGQYYHGEMSPEEKLLFESEMAANKELESLYNTYKATDSVMYKENQYDAEIAALKNTMDKAYGNYTAVKEKEPKEPAKVIFWKNKSFKIAVSAAASVMVVLAGYLTFFNGTQSAPQLANDYTEQNITHISQKMSGSGDSLQQGITAYNNKDYNNALRMFQGVTANNPANRDAKEYTGYVYLVTGEYDNALQQFDDLIRMGGKFNRGTFLKAVTLLKRNAEGDKVLAKQLLRQVVNEKTGDHKLAGEWLKKLDGKE